MSDDWEGRHHDHSTEVDPSWAVAQLVARNYTLAAILTDLIAELRELATCDIDLGNQTDPETIAFLLDRAEARLREVTGDE